MPRTDLPRSAAPAAGLVALLLALSGCGVDSSPARAVAAEPAATASRSASAAAAPSSPSPSSPSPSSPSPSATPAPASPPPSAAPAPTSPAPSTPPPPRSAATPAATRSAGSYDVSAVQRRLEQLRYYGGEVDGRTGPAMRSAVMAFQKVNGLVADGVVGPRTLAALAAPRTPQLRAASPADRVEVDLDRQVLHVVQGGRIVRILPVSSGNGETYRQRDGARVRALTPVGTYRIERRIAGVRQAALGTLHDPQYFHRGWAIHGSDSVPAQPASHGCVRVTRADAKTLLQLLDVGTTVHLYGGRHVFTPGGRDAGTSGP